MRRFNPEKELRKIQNGNRNRIILFVISLLVVGVMGYSFAIYQVRYSKRIIYTKVAPFSSKDIELAVNIKGEGTSDRFPTSSELSSKGIKFTGLECDNDGITTATWNSSKGGLELFTTGPNKCTVNFGKTHTIKVVVSNGRVDKETQEVNTNGSSEEITITPDVGYGVENIICTNNQKIEQTAKNSFKITNVISDTICTIPIAKLQTLFEYCTPNDTLSSCISKSLVAENLVEDDTTDKNIRYIGFDPNNYIWFNCDTYSGLTEANASQHCEKWRIIGLMNNVETESKGTQHLVKIIRDEPLPNYLVWDNKPSGTGSSLSAYGSNDWTDSRLMMLLNPGYSSHELNASGTTGSLYWNHQNGKCSGDPSGGLPVSDGKTIDCNFSTEGLKGDDTDSTKSMIETVKWKLGERSSIEGAKPSDWYEAERNTTVSSNRKPFWIGKIGLIYPSDYGYATGGGRKYDRQACLNYATSAWQSGDYNLDCAQTDWLHDYNATQWTLTPNSSNSTSVFNAHSYGPISSYSAGGALRVRPTLYLTSTTKISFADGNGSYSNPYILVP